MDDTAEKLTVRGGEAPAPTRVAPKPNEAPRKPKRLLMTFAEGGDIQHTLRDDFFRPFPEADRSIARMTSIDFDEKKQKFFIKFERGVRLSDVPGKDVHLKDVIVTIPFVYAVHRSNMNFVKSVADSKLDTDTMYFDMYEKAVIFELDIVEKLRVLGFTF